MQRFHSADVLLFSLPIWNFGIPYKLKQLIDVVSHKDVLFRFDGTRFDGTLQGRKAVAIYTRGLGYAKDTATPTETFDSSGRIWRLGFALSASRTFTL